MVPNAPYLKGSKKLMIEPMNYTPNDFGRRASQINRRVLRVTYVRLT